MDIEIFTKTQKQIAHNFIDAFISEGILDMRIGVSSENEILMAESSSYTSKTLAIDEDGDVLFYRFSTNGQESHNEFFDVDKGLDYPAIVNRFK